MSTTNSPKDPKVTDDDHRGRGDQDKDKDKDRKSITLVVYAPNDPDHPKHMPFKVTITVGDAARQAAEKFGYHAEGSPSFRTQNGDVLDRSVTLDAAGLRHKDEVDLVDVGGGV